MGWSYNSKTCGSWSINCKCSDSMRQNESSGTPLGEPSKPVLVRPPLLSKSSTCAILNCPQGTQRGLLCLSQAPDPRDIESLVGSIPPQRAQMLTTLQIPDGDGPIIA